MRERQPGERVECQVTYLEMRAPPKGGLPPLPLGPETALMRAEAPPADYFLYLYGAVGGPWEWTDWLERPRAEVEAFVGDSQVDLWTLMVDGWPGGFFMLDTREAGVCDLAYFGLVSQATGRRLGPWLLGTAIREGWGRPGIERLTVNTCTLDHPAALGLYQRLGFVPVGRETQSRVLTRPRAVA